MSSPLEALAIVLEAPERVVVNRLALTAPTDDDVVVDVQWSGISTGTERLLWSGEMPAFPGMGYPLVPGYEAVGRITQCGRNAGREIGTQVFVPGARCFGDVRGLFGGSAQRLVVAGNRTTVVAAKLGDSAVLLALAATAYHAVAAGGPDRPDLIVGHGVLGRLMARITLALGAPAPTVWERNSARHSGAAGYTVMQPDQDARRDYRAIYDASGDATLLEPLIGRLARGGEVVLAGFYSDPLSFNFPAAFMREARIRVAAEWRDADMAAVAAMVHDGRLSLDGLITHRVPAAHASSAYPTAFSDSSCLKMVLNWSATE